MNIPFDCPNIIIIHMFQIVLCTTEPMHEYNPSLIYRIRYQQVLRLSMNSIQMLRTCEFLLSLLCVFRQLPQSRLLFLQSSRATWPWFP